MGGGDVRGWWGVEVVSFEIVRGLGASGQGESTVESFEMLEEALAEMSSAFPKPRITVITPRLAKSAAPQEYPRGMFTSAYMFVQVVDLRYRTSQKIPKKDFIWLTRPRPPNIIITCKGMTLFAHTFVNSDSR